MSIHLPFHTTAKVTSDRIPLPFHPSFFPTYERLKKWLARFRFSEDSSLFINAILLYSLAKKKYLDHRKSSHLFRVVLSLYLMQKKLIELTVFSAQTRHISVRCIPTELLFPFTSEYVLGCIIGFNLFNRCELFDEQNLIIALQKRYPDLEFVKESFYKHTSYNEDVRLFYFEIKQRCNSSFTPKKVKAIKEDLEKKIEHSIQKLSLPICGKSNQEETYKSLFALSNEIRSIDDIPQVSIKVEKRLDNGILFLITVVQLAPFHRFSFKDRICGCIFTSEQVLPVKELDGHSVEARIVRALLPFKPALLRVDGSLDQPAARQQISDILRNILGEFRDYNGGLLIKQQELLNACKEECKDLNEEETDYLDHFFYSLMPLDRQVTLQPRLIRTLFLRFLECRQEELPADACYSFRTFSDGQDGFIIIRVRDASLLETLSETLRNSSFNTKQFVYNIFEMSGSHFLNCILLNTDLKPDQSLIARLHDDLLEWSNKNRKKHILKIALESPIYSLDPRTGGEHALRFLFEGLTRFNQKGELEGGIAQSIELSPDSKRYTFRLRPALWNDGSMLSAHDFVYSWKKILSPDFETQFATLLYPIKNAREAREGKVPIDSIGLQVINDQTLEVELAFPTPYFLDLLAQSPFFPVNRRLDKQSPQWPYQAGTNYLCNGPFQLKVNEPNQGYHFIKNPYYWDSASITLDQILLKPMDPIRAAQAFQNNEVDWIGNPFGGWHDSVFSNQDNSRVVSIPNGWVCWCVFNATHPLLQNHKLRYAFAHAVDRSHLTYDTSPPLSPAYSLLAPQYRVSRGSLFPEYNIDRARELFHEALHELGLTPQGLRCLTLTYSPTGLRESIARSLKQQFEECFHIECNLEPLPWNVLFPKVTSGKFDLALTYWTSWIDDPIYTFNAFRFANQGGNMSRWQNADYQNILDRSEQATNPFQRSSHLLEAEKILSQQIPALPLIYQPFQALTKANFHFATSSLGNSVALERSYFKQQEVIYDSSIITKSRDAL